jgi:methyl-accepting chemotaxis protein
MAKTTVGRLNVVLSAVSQPFERGVRRAIGRVQSFTSSIRQSLRFITGWGSALAGIAIGGGLFMAVRRTMQMMDQTGKLSDRLGIATQDLIAFRHAAELSGVGANVLDQSLERMVRRLGEARHGTGEAAKALERMGLSAQQLTRESPAQAFRTIAQAISEQETAADKANAAYAVFGRQGQQLINMMDGGAEALDRASEEVERLGISFDRVDARRVEMANDAMTKLHAATAGLVQRLTIELAPAITALAEATTDWLTNSENGTVKFDSAIQRLSDSLKFVGRITALIRAAWNLLGFAIGTVVTLISKAVELILKAAQRAADAIPGISLNLRGAIETMELATASLADVTIDKLDNMEAAWEDLVQGITSKRIDNALNDIRERAKESMGATANTFNEVDLEARAAIDRIIESLERQRDTFGMTATEIRLFELANAGASDEVMAHAKAIGEQIRALEEQADAVNRAREETEEWQKIGERIFADTRTELEKYESQIDKLNEALERGVIDWETYGRAVREARANLEGAAQVDRPGGPRLAGAAERGTVAAASIIARASANREQRDIARNTKNAADELAQQTDSLANIESIIATPPKIVRF